MIHLLRSPNLLVLIHSASWQPGHHQWVSRHVTSLFMSTPLLCGQESQNEIRYMNMLPLIPIAPISANVARSYGRVSHVFSRLISMFVFDIVQIHSGCSPPTCTSLATGQSPRFPSIVLWTVDKKFITTETSTFVPRKNHNAIKSDIIKYRWPWISGQILLETVLYGRTLPVCLNAFIYHPF